MTRTSIIAIALFSSACATDLADYEDTVSDAEAELEEIIRQLNDDDDEEESSSEKSGPNNISSPAESSASVAKTIYEMAMAEFKAELKECNPVRAIAGKYSPDKQTVHGHILDAFDMLTGEIHGKYTTNGNGAGPFKGAMMDHDLFADSASGPKVALEGAYEDLEIVAETCTGSSVAAHCCSCDSHATAGLCDIAEYCDDNSIAELCSGSSDYCDGSSVAETCTGSSIAEHCDGSSVAEVCTGISVAETCSGSSYTVFLSLSPNVNGDSAPVLGMIAICD